MNPGICKSLLKENPPVQRCARIEPGSTSSERFPEHLQDILTRNLIHLTKDEKVLLHQYGDVFSPNNQD